MNVNDWTAVILFAQQEVQTDLIKGKHVFCGELRFGGESHLQVVCGSEAR